MSTLLLIWAACALTAGAISLSNIVRDHRQITVTYAFAILVVALSSPIALIGFAFVLFGHGDRVLWRAREVTAKEAAQ